MLRAAKSELCSLRSAVVWTNIGAHSSLLGTSGIPLDWHSWVGGEAESSSRHPAICIRNKHLEINDIIHTTQFITWWRHDMATLKGNPPVTSGFPSQRTGNTELWHTHHSNFYMVTGGFPSQRTSNTELWHTHNSNYYMVVSWPWTISALPALSEWSPHLSIHDITYPISVTVKPVYNDHLMGYFSAFWSSSRWPLAT